MRWGPHVPGVGGAGAGRSPSPWRPAAVAAPKRWRRRHRRPPAGPPGSRRKRRRGCRMLRPSAGAVEQGLTPLHTHTLGTPPPVVAPSPISPSLGLPLPRPRSPLTPPTPLGQTAQAALHGKKPSAANLLFPASGRLSSCYSVQLCGLLGGAGVAGLGGTAKGRRGGPEAGAGDGSAAGSPWGGEGARWGRVPQHGRMAAPSPGASYGPRAPSPVAPGLCTGGRGSAPGRGRPSPNPRLISPRAAAGNRRAAFLFPKPPAPGGSPPDGPRS